jgi:hypothetical protein
VGVAGPALSMSSLESALKSAALVGLRPVKASASTGAAAGSPAASPSAARTDSRAPRDATGLNTADAPRTGVPLTAAVLRAGAAPRT